MASNSLISSSGVRRYMYKSSVRANLIHKSADYCIVVPSPMDCFEALWKQQQAASSKSL